MEAPVESSEDAPEDGLQQRAPDSPPVRVNDESTSSRAVTIEKGDLPEKSKYPHLPLLFLLSTTVGQSYSATGLQAVLELYFVRFLYVCSGGHRASKLSTASVNVYIAIYQLCALTAGFLADKVIGNFLTQSVSVIITTIGLFMLTFSTWQYTLYMPDCCQNGGHNDTIAAVLSSTVTNTESLFSGVELSAVVNTTSNCSELNKVILLDQLNLHISPTVNIVLAIGGLVLFAIGYGHTNTLQSVFVADQFKEEESKAKERSFSWYYLCCNVGSLLGESGMPVLRQSVGFVVAWLTVFGSTVISTILFLAGTCFYIKKKPQRITCCRKSKKDSINVSASDMQQVSKRETEPLLAASGAQKDKETAASVSNKPTQRVQMLSRLRELVPFLGVFAPLVVFWAIFYQQNSTWILQGTQMDCYLGKLHVPPDLMPSINDFLVILIIPFLDYVVYPHFERSMGYRVMSLHKLVAGMVAASLSFLLSGLLQLYLSEPVSDCHGNVNIMWQLPQILLISFAEVLVSVTGLEFAYSQAPPDFRNIIMSFWYISQALGTLLNAGIAQIPGLTLMEEFFTYMALMVLVTVLFVVINRRYQYRQTTVKTQ